MGSTESVSAVTAVPKAGAPFLWQIQNFSTLPIDGCYQLCSPTFTLHGRSWQLQLYPNAWSAKTDGFVSVFLKNEQFDDVHNEVAFSVLDSEGRDKCFIEYRAALCKARTSSGCPKLVSRWDLFDPAKGLLVNDTLRVRCIVNCWMPQSRMVALSDVRFSRPKDVGASPNMGKLLDDPKFSDVTLLVGETKIPAHKVILATHSPVFEAMFSHEMAESLEGVVHIDDVALPVFRKVLRYMYTGSSALDDRDNQSQQSQWLFNLLMAADRFQITELVNSCVQQLTDALTVANAAEYLILADSIQSDVLKARIIEFVRADSRRLKSVMQADAFQRLGLEQVKELLAAFGNDSTA